MVLEINLGRSRELKLKRHLEEEHPSTKGNMRVKELAGMSIGMGLIGDSLGGDIGTKLGQAGETSANFISPMINISMGRTTIKMLKGLK